MGARIKEYIRYINALLESEDEQIDWEEERRKHLVQIAFFAHERLIHLIVTVLFAILTVLIFLYLLGHFTVSLLALLVVVMVLLVPYIKHYFYIAITEILLLAA